MTRDIDSVAAAERRWLLLLIFLFAASVIVVAVTAQTRRAIFSFSLARPTPSAFAAVTGSPPAPGPNAAIRIGSGSPAIRAPGRGITPIVLTSPTGLFAPSNQPSGSVVSPGIDLPAGTRSPDALAFNSPSVGGPPVGTGFTPDAGGTGRSGTDGGGSGGTIITQPTPAATPTPIPTAEPTPPAGPGTPVSPVPEPGFWALAILGFGMIGARLRVERSATRRRRSVGRGLADDQVVAL